MKSRSYRWSRHTFVEPNLDMVVFTFLGFGRVRRLSFYENDILENTTVRRPQLAALTFDDTKRTPIYAYAMPTTLRIASAHNNEDKQRAQ